MKLLKSAVLWAIDKGMRPLPSALDRVSELILLRRLLQRLRIDCVLDVGANEGQFALELRSIGYSGHIVSFEPVTRTFEALCKVFAGDPNWNGLHSALGSQRQTASINVHATSLMSSLLEARVNDERIRQEVVQVQRLDAVLPALLTQLDVSRVFLKMDTQGYDTEVFRGAAGCMDCIHGLQSELSVQPLYKDMPRYLDALQLYEASGFELFNLSVVNRVSDGGLLEMNCFMQRPQ